MSSKNHHFGTVMALVFDYVSFGIPLGSRKGKSVEVNMMLGGGGRLWTPSLGLCKDMPFNAVTFYALYSVLPQPSLVYKDER